MACWNLWQCRESLEWHPRDPDDHSLPSNLRVVTWNTWFEADEREARAAALLSRLREIEPHLVALQEVNLRYLRLLLEDHWIRANYWCSASLTSPPASLGVVLLGRGSGPRLQGMALPGPMGRRAVQAHFPGLQVVALHLESSRSSGEIRSAQWNLVEAALEQDCLVLGDFNFCASWPENARLPDRLQDLWSTLESGSGYTVDGLNNPLVRIRDKGVRFDRILLGGNRWRAQSIRLLGQEPLEVVREGRSRSLRVSDHFGLLAELRECPEFAADDR